MLVVRRKSRREGYEEEVSEGRGALFTQVCGSGLTVKVHFGSHLKHEIGWMSRQGWGQVKQMQPASAMAVRQQESKLMFQDQLKANTGWSGVSQRA